MGKIATCTVYVISALPQQGRKKNHLYKAMLRAYCSNIYILFFAGLDPHTSIYLVRTRKKSEIETHPPKAASLWYRVGRKTTFFLFCFKGKRAFESSSVRATTKRPFLLVLLPKERPMPPTPTPLPLPPPTANGNSRHGCR